jgi:cell division septal protein FtsQ
MESVNRRFQAGRRPAARPAWRVPWARLAGATGAFALGWCLYWLTSDPAFAVDASALTVEGARFTSQAQVREATSLDAEDRPNLFRIPTDTMEAALGALPAVRGAIVTTSVPDGVRIQLVEREPILVWRTGTGSWLVDVEGRAFATADSTSGLPVIEDMRPSDPGLAVGSDLAPLDLEVARLLGAVTPAAIGTGADSLSLRVEPDEGWVLEAPGQWRAVFGNYAATVRSTDLIPLQVQCLGALLAQERPRLVTLSVAADRCGTFRGPGARPRDRTGRTADPGARRTPGPRAERTPAPRNRRP